MIFRIPSVLILSAFLTLMSIGLSVSRAQDNGGVNPQMPPLERYQRLWENSPFTLPTSDPNGGEVVGLATQYKLVGLSKSGGDYLVSVLEIASGSSMTLGKDPNEKGLSIDKVQMSENFLEVEVILRRNQEVAPLRFDQEMIKTAAPQTPVPGGATMMPAGVPGGSGAAPVMNTPPPPPKRIIRRTTNVPNKKP